MKSDSVKKLFIDDENLIGSFLSNDIFDQKTGIIYFEVGDEVTENTFKYLKDKDINNFDNNNLISISGYDNLIKFRQFY